MHLMDFKKWLSAEKRFPTPAIDNKRDTGWFATREMDENVHTAGSNLDHQANAS